MSTGHPLMQFFTYAHLPPHLQEASKPFCEIAEKLAAMSTDEREENGYAALGVLREKLEGLPSNSESMEADAKLAFAQDGVCERYELDDLLRYVLEAKDCAVRAVLFKGPGF
jgi:hypothetical protein